MAKSVDFNNLYHRYPCLQNQPISRRILFENIIRHQNISPISQEKLVALANGEAIGISFRPARVIMQDYAGMPALIDLAALRDTVRDAGNSPDKINPQVPVDLVVDHSVMAKETRHPGALAANLEDEFSTNKERYSFLKWASQAFKGLRIVPPGQGIIHQVNTEFFATIVTESQFHGEQWQYPDTLIGTDSHTTMVNGMGVLGWGVGGIEAEAVMLGEAISMIAPAVIAVWLEGNINEGVLATDVVLTLTELLRKKGVVGKIVEFCGPGVRALSATDRLTIANMAPEFGATAAFFPVDEKTLDYLKLTGRSAEHIAKVEKYLKNADLFYSPDFRPDCEESVSYNLNNVDRVVAGPSRPDERRTLAEIPAVIDNMSLDDKKTDQGLLAQGDLVIASITSCTNTANPEAMITAGLLARNANHLGLSVRSTIKTSLAPGSKVVTAYLKRLGLLEDLAALGFDIVAYGCTTCVGNSGELLPEVTEALDQKETLVSSVLSGNRNFEGRIHPRVKANFLASPPLVVAYAIAGTMKVDLDNDPIGTTSDGKKVYLKDIWPTPETVTEALYSAVTKDQFLTSYKTITEGSENWSKLSAPIGSAFNWSSKSTYLRKPPFFEQKSLFQPGEAILNHAKPLALLGDFITTDHISPVGRISPGSSAAQYLESKGVAAEDFNAYGARRGEHEIMTRGTLANVRLQNRLVSRLGGWTQLLPDGEEMTIYDASRTYQDRNEDIVIIAGKMYGAGSARDWAAKGTRLLGVKAVLAGSFERIHRSNLIRMGILPIQFADGISIEELNLGPLTRISIQATVIDLSPFAKLKTIITDAKEASLEIVVTAMIETDEELVYLNSGGILPYVAKQITKE